MGGKKQKTRHGASGGLPNGVMLAGVDTSEFTHPALQTQAITAAWIVNRCRVPAATAGAIAELAFSHGRAWR